MMGFSLLPASIWPCSCSYVRRAPKHKPQPIELGQTYFERMLVTIEQWFGVLKPHGEQKSHLMLTQIDGGIKLKAGSPIFIEALDETKAWLLDIAVRIGYDETMDYT